MPSSRTKADRTTSEMCAWNDKTYSCKEDPEIHKAMRCYCVGCDIVQADHAPEAGVAQVIFHGILVRHQGKTSGRGGRKT